jgi:ABC-2 type transport system permease protein
MKLLFFALKELADFSRRKWSVATILLAPAVVVLLLTGIVQLSADSFIATPNHSNHLYTSVSNGQSLQTETADALVSFLSIIMVMLPVTWASQSIVTERTRKTLEPLLSAPISSTFILLGKALPPVVVAVLIVCWCLLVCGVVATWRTGSFTMVEIILLPANLGMLFLVGPFLGLASALFSLGVSAKSVDARAAMQRSTLLSLPLLIGSALFASLVGTGKLGLLTIGTLVAASIAGTAFIYAKSRFQRESLIN